MDKGYKYYLKLIFNVLIPVMAIAAAVLLLIRLTMFFLPFVLGYIIAMIANPAVSFLQKKISIKRKHSSVLIVAVVLLIIIWVIYIAISSLITFGVGFLEDLPGYLSGLSATLDGLFTRYQGIIDMLPEDIALGLMEFRTNMSSIITGLLSGIVVPTVDLSASAVRSVPGLFINVLVFFISAFCFIFQWENIQLFIRKHMPKAIAGYMDYLKNDTKKILGSWLKAQIKIMGVVFLVLAISFLILRVQYAIPLALLTAFLDFLPAFGVGFIMWPWIVIEILSGNFLMALWLSVVYLATQAVRNTLQPKIMGDTMGLSPLCTLLFLFLGYKFYGIAGMIFAVPIGMFCISLYRYGLFDRMLHSIYELLCFIGGFFGREEQPETGNSKEDDGNGRGDMAEKAADKTEKPEGSGSI